MEELNEDRINVITYDITYTENDQNTMLSQHRRDRSLIEIGLRHRRIHIRGETKL